MRRKRSDQANHDTSIRSRRRSNITISLIIALTFLAGLSVGKIAFREKEIMPDSVQEIRQGKYEFINPLLECEVAEDSIRVKALLPIKGIVQERIGSLSRQGTISSASLYYRDLNNGPTFGVNEKEGYIPSSLLKVVTMMTVLQAAEYDTKLLDRKILYTSPDRKVRQNIQPSESMSEGSSYTIDELVYRMIAHSDNNAVVLLTNFLGAEKILQIYRDLGVPTPVSGKTYLLSTKEYASFFRILFNASYLSRAMSEKALSYLAQSEFKTGIVAGVPSSIKVAHKFGEREIPQPNGTVIRQLHDCGIVYFPDHPYLICIMTQGDSFDKLSDAIGDISKTVYDELTHQY